MVPDVSSDAVSVPQLKPYVSYRCPEVIQEEFTARDLFNAVYSDKITADFERGALTAAGEPLEPSSAEALTADRARQRARAVNADIWEK